MSIFKKHLRLSLLALVMPIPMILSVDMKEPFAQFLFMGSFFAVMVPTLIVRMRGDLPMSDFMAVGGLIMGGWVFLVFGRAIVLGLLGKEL